MFSWGEESRGGFRLRSADRSADGCVDFLKFSFCVKNLSAGRSVIAFVKTDGNASVIITRETEEGRRVKGKQKFVKCEEKIQAVRCGDDDVTLLSDQGHVFCVDTSRSPLTARPLEALWNIPVSHVTCGSRHSLALTKGGQVFTWGLDAASPQHLKCLSAIPVVQITAGGEQSFALSVSGNVFAWGRNHRGQLGLGDTTDRAAPSAVHSLNMKQSVHVSCGEDHTAILTKGGAVFTFGSAQFGQLGHNSLADELRPRLVAELWGAKVTKIACGRHHTLALTASNDVYAFGCGEQGQLGNGRELHQPVPLPVHLPQHSREDQKITNIYAGGNSSFAVCSSDEEVGDGLNEQNSLELFIDKWISECDLKSLKKTKQEIRQIFSSASCVNGSFVDRSREKHLQTSLKFSGLDLSRARRAFSKLMKSDEVLAEVEAAVVLLLPSLDEKPLGVEGLRIFPLLHELLHVIYKHKRQQSSELAETLAAAVLRLSADSQQVLGDWWSSLKPSSMVKHVEVWKQTLSIITSSVPAPHYTRVKNLLRVLQCFYNVSRRTEGAPRIPHGTFYLRINPPFLHEDLRRWRFRSNMDVHDEAPVVCSFAFMMDLQSKKTAFDIYTACMKSEHQQHQDVGFPSPFFELLLKRTKLWDGAFEQLAAADHRALKKPLVVYFDENSTLSDVNKRDFFLHVFKEMMSAQSGMFMFNDSKTLAWFPSKKKKKKEEEENTQWYFLFGILCGLSLYNQSTIHLPFPVALFKKLLGVAPSLDDMKEFDPELGKHLQSILEDLTDDDIENLYMSFSVNWDGTAVQLDPQNPEKQLTSQNKKEYVDAYVSHAFTASVHGTFEAFRRGFFQVCDVDMVMMFRPEELKVLMVGQDVYDWTKLRQSCVYEGVYHEHHSTIHMFWEVFDELSEDQKKSFLLFLTGFKKVPILGMEQIRMRFQVLPAGDGTYDLYLPEALTCHALLQLPLYSSKQVMRVRITEALKATGGFIQ